MTVAEMLSRMSSREFTEWRAADSLDAQDAQQADLEREARAGVERRHQRPARWR